MAQAIKDRQTPQTIQELRSFLGLAKHCSPLINQFSIIALPLTDILQGEVKAGQKNILD
jgi:hypothetical protein